jgi:hypothetical protein
MKRQGVVRWVLAAIAMTWIAGGSAVGVQGAEGKGGSMTYREAKGFLEKFTKVIELTSDDGQARVAICPDWQGRVMTSTCGGPDGLSFGFLNRPFIEAGKPNRQFNNYGGEDRLWLSPEGGQFSLWFKPGVAQTIDNWFTPPAMNEGPFEVVSSGGDGVCRMARRMQLENASSTRFDLAVTRQVRLLDSADLKHLFGESAARQMTQAGVRRVAYETANTITNQGQPMTKEKGLVSIWMLGMLNSGPKTVVIVPYKPGDESCLGPVVRSDYFGSVPPERLKILPEAILFLGDGNYRSKIGTSQQRAKNVLGSMDFQAGVLTLVHFTMPDDPTQHPYMNNLWQLPQAEPYVGDVANSYNDGPLGPGKPGLGPFYEIESLSPAAALKPGESLTHCHRTVHIQAEMPVLAQLARQVLGVDLDKVRHEMLGK